MILLDRLSGAATTHELRHTLSQQSLRWKARRAAYLTYDEVAQVLEMSGGADTIPLTRELQPGLAALSLRKNTDQALAWPEDLVADLPLSNYRVSLPILHWGNLIAVLLLAFDQEPDLSTLEEIDEATRVLGVVGHSVNEREKTNDFILRSQELLVHAVEAQGQTGHVGRCSRVALSLAAMLDCSAQAKAELMQAVQYHDVGLLAFSDPRSPSALREHPLRGARLLSCHPDLHAVAPLVESHHERYDGSGMPTGAKGDELSLDAWILALTEDLVETWENSDGPYADRVKIFFTTSAKHHHPDVVDALCGLVDSDKLQSLLEG